MKNAWLWISAIAAVGVGAYAWSKSDKRSYIISYFSGYGDTEETKAAFRQIVGQMDDSEIDAVYKLIHDYMKPGLIVPNGSPLQLKLQAISSRYNIFT